MPVRRLHQEDHFRPLRHARGLTHRPDLMPRRVLEGRRLSERYGETESAEREFAELVVTRIAAGVLRYSDRQALLAAAARMGIGRFDANLLIAMAQHRCKRNVQPVTERRGRWHLIVAATALQAAILAGFYWIMR